MTLSTRQRRPLPALTLTFVVILLAGCSHTGDQSAENTPSAPATDGPSPTQSTDNGTPTHDGGGNGAGGSTEELILASQYELGGTGGFDQVTCGELGATGSDIGGPAVWIGPHRSEITYGEPVGAYLCLVGFNTDEPINVSVSTPLQTYVTQVVVAGDVPSDMFTRASRYTLIGAAESLEVFTFDRDVLSTVVADPELFAEPHGYLRSLAWTFAPPADLRDALANSGQLDIEARQGATVANTTQTIHLRGPGLARIDGPVDHGELLVLGFPPGARVPIGLYKLGEVATERSATLVKELGALTMPPSQVVEYQLPAGLISGLPEGDYCAMPPLQSPTQYDCDQGRVD